MRHKFNHCVLGYLVGTLCGLFIFSEFSTIAHAQNDEFIPLGIPPLSNRVPLLSFPLSVFPEVDPEAGVVIPVRRFQELEEITVRFEDQTMDRLGLNIQEDFQNLVSDALSSGLSLYKESGAKPEGFNFAVGDVNSDLPLNLLERPEVVADSINPGVFFVTFRPIPGRHQLNLLKDAFPDFYIVAQTSLEIMQGDRFEVTIPANGLKIRDLIEPLPDDTVYDVPFPDESFRAQNPEFAEPAIFEGDIVEIFSMVNDVDNSTRIDANSEARTIFGLDFAGREDQEYFIEEVRVNWIGINLAQVAKLIGLFTQAEYFGARSAGVLASAQSTIVDQPSLLPTFFFSPWFYNFPIDPETGLVLIEERTVAGEDIQYPMTMPLDINGIPRDTFFLPSISDDLNSHITGYVSYGPRLPFAEGLAPRIVSQDILLGFSQTDTGGIFLFREFGGLEGQYDQGIDQLITLNQDQFRIETFGISADDIRDHPENNPALRALVENLMPGTIGGQNSKEVLSFLFEDSNLATVLMGVGTMPAEASEPRPPWGTLECYLDPDCLFFDLMINVLRPFLGLTEGQIRYLFENTGGNGLTNMEELYGFPILQGFSFVLPVARDNPKSALIAPTVKTGGDAGPDLYVAIRTSDQLRNLDSFIPFIQPKDIKVGNQVTQFTQGESVEKFSSVSSIGYQRKNTGTTFAMVGRPKPRFQLQDLTQSGPGDLENNDNILFNDSLGSPPKAVIGIDATDFGQNANLVLNNSLVNLDLFDTFFTENAVLGEIQIDFLPGSITPTFNPMILAVIPTNLQVDLPFTRIISAHSASIYVEDDTPSGNNTDDDGDGLIDEEDYNLIDDDGDGLIDEDLGDGSPAGRNGIYDSFDKFLPFDRDRRGFAPTFGDSQFTFIPNDVAKFDLYLQEILPVTNPPLVEEGRSIPLDLIEGSRFTELDFRALNNANYRTSRFFIFPFDLSRPFSSRANPWDPPEYNQGMFPRLEPVTGLMELITAMRGFGFADFPLFPEDLFIEDKLNGDALVWLITLNTEADTSIQLVVDPDGDARRTFALSIAASFRFPDPIDAFVRVGNVPMVVNTGGPTAQNPQGDNLNTDFDPYVQFGLFISLVQPDAISDYLIDLADNLGDAYINAAELRDDYETDVAQAEEDAAAADPPEEPQYPDAPEPVEVAITDPYDAFGINEFLDTNNGNYDTNYEYQIQIPDENLGPLAGNDFYVVLRSSEDARVGETFHVRLRSGIRDDFITVPDPVTNEPIPIDAPERGDWLSLVH